MQVDDDLFACPIPLPHHIPSETSGLFCGGFFPLERNDENPIPGRYPLTKNMALVMEYVEETVKVHEKATEQQLLDALAEVLGPQLTARWFGAGTVLCYENEQVIFGLKNPFAVDWARSNFQKEVDQACRNVLGQSRPCRFVLASTLLEKPSQTPALTVMRLLPATVITTAGGSELPTGGPVGINPHFVLQNVRPSIDPNHLDEVVKFDSAITPLAQRPGSPLMAGSAASPCKTNPSRVRSDGTRGRQFASLETFVRGTSNEFAMRAADLAINHPAQINPIYIFGPTSVGKTHLVEGIWSAVRRIRGRKPPLYLRAEDFVSSFLSNILPGSSRSGLQEFRAKFKDISLFILDDIQYLSGKVTQGEFLNVLDQLKNRGVQIVVTGDRPLKEHTVLRSEIICRLEAGIVCPIDQPEREMALRIFRNMVGQRELPIGDDVCRLVASRLGAHARQLLGALNRLHAQCLSSDESVTVEQAEKILADLIRNNRRDVRLRDIEKAVCDTFGLTEEAIQSKSRAKLVTAPRMLAMWLARKYTRSALSEIGKYFGNRSHSTVVAAQQKVDQWVDTDHPIHSEMGDISISEAIQKIEHRLQTGV